MRRSPETSIKAALGDTLTAVLGLCALTFATTASAGVTRLCDTQSIDPPDLDIPTAELTVELIDLGAAAPVDLDVTIDANGRALPAPPDVDAMLQQMFNLSDATSPSALRASSPATDLPLAELSPPAIRTDVPIPEADEAEADAENDTARPAVSTRVPGLSEDDLQRFRRKMYRTDI